MLMFIKNWCYTVITDRYVDADKLQLCYLCLLNVSFIFYTHFSPVQIYRGVKTSWYQEQKEDCDTAQVHKPTFRQNKYSI